MAKITINQDKCKGCLLCISFCPRGLISVERNLNRRGIRPAKFSRWAHKSAGGNSQECLGCAMCAIICPDCCIEVYK
jgi:2-oxoglutarate ferredoxin oxidoreductase subunit delta